MAKDNKNNFVLPLDGAAESDAKNVAYQSIPTLEYGDRYEVTGFFIGYDWGFKANKFFITSASAVSETRVKFSTNNYGVYQDGVSVTRGKSIELAYKFTISDEDAKGLTASDYVNMVSFKSADEETVKAEMTASKQDTAGNRQNNLKLTGVKEGTTTVTAKIAVPAKGDAKEKVLFSKDIKVTVEKPVTYTKISKTSDIKANDKILLTFTDSDKTYAFAAEELSKYYYLKAVEVTDEKGVISSINGASVLTLEDGKKADSYYFHADNGKYLSSSVSTDDKGTHYNTILADKSDATNSLLTIAYDDKGVLSVKSGSGVFVTGTVYKGTAEIQGASSNKTSPLAIYKKTA